MVFTSPPDKFWNSPQFGLNCLVPVFSNSLYGMVLGHRGNFTGFFLLFFIDITQGTYMKFPLQTLRSLNLSGKFLCSRLITHGQEAEVTVTVRCTKLLHCLTLYVSGCGYGTKSTCYNKDLQDDSWLYSHLWLLRTQRIFNIPFHSHSSYPSISQPVKNLQIRIYRVSPNYIP